MADDVDSLYAVAAQYHRAGRAAEAIPLYERLLASSPKRLDAQINLGNALIACGRVAEAEATFRLAIALQPNIAEIHNNLGHALEKQGKNDDAAAAYRHAIDLDPNYGDALYNLGNIFCERGKHDDAIALYCRALALKPDFAKGYHGLGSALIRSGRTAEGLAAFTRSAELTYGKPGNVPHEGVSKPHKLRHDKEQRDYLAGGKAKDSDPPVETLLRLVDGERLTGPAVNPDNARAITKQWMANRPQIVTIDNFLTKEALENLRRFCWGSTVWRRVYDDGYLGAMPDYGFACPLLAQIVDELRSTFPTIFGEHRLHYLWAFKYDSTLSGIAIHADKAAVNVNFWVTPDEANLDPKSGGLVVWDVAAPLDWKPAQYNGDTAACRSYLARVGARPVTIPYRANRAVIFDSDLFHETDKIAFKDGYTNRRINITLLYGVREPSDKDDRLANTKFN